MNINIIASPVYFDMPEENVVSEISQGLMNEGIDSDNLAELVSGEYAISYQDTIKKVFKELNINFPSHKEAGMALAKYYSTLIINNMIDPYGGAKKIWLEIECKEEFENEFDNIQVFSALASEYEDFTEKEQTEFYGDKECVSKQSKIKTEIIKEAELFLKK